MQNKKKFLSLLAIITISCALLISCSGSTDSGDESTGTPVRVGWTQDTENGILGNMAAILIQNSLDIPVETSENLGGTGIAHEAIIEGELDLYVDYTGDALANVLKQDPITESEKAYEAVKEGYLEEFDITWLEPTPFNNTYALAVKEDVADDLNLATISDLEPQASEWIIGSSVEFANRELDGYAGMVNHYGFEFKEIKPMDVGLMYTAVSSDEVDVIVAFATDARIGKLGLKVLEDDLNFFPSYNAAPTVRNDVLDQYPEIADTLNEVFTQLDTETMIELNGQVDTENKNPKTVAEEYLKDQGYIE